MNSYIETIMKNRILFLAIVIAFSSCITEVGSKKDDVAQDKLPVNFYTTGGHTLYHLQPATVKRGGRVVIGAAYDGAVLCYSPSGDLRWKAETGDGFPFDLCVA